MSQKLSDVLTSRFRAKVVSGIDVEENIIYVHFTDGSQIRVEAHGYEGTRLELYTEYMQEEKFDLCSE